MFLVRKLPLFRPNSFLSLRHTSKELPECVCETRTISQAEVDRFAELTGDFNPVHSASHPIEKRAIHGAFLNGIVAGIIGTKLPGPGSISVSQAFSFPNRCVVDLPIEIRVHMVSDRKLIDVKYECEQQGRLVFKGTARIMMQK